MLCPLPLRNRQPLENTVTGPDIRILCSYVLSARQGPSIVSTMLVLIGLCWGGAAAAEPSEVEGLWATGGSLVQVSRVGDGLEMVVVALEEPVDHNGEPLLDKENPDESQRSQPILGMNLLENYSYSRKRWEGKIYDPESGNTYSSRMHRKADVLEMRGYIGTPLLGRTKKFKSINLCREDMLEMLKSANIIGYCGL